LVKVIWVELIWVKVIWVEVIRCRTLLVKPIHCPSAAAELGEGQIPFAAQSPQGSAAPAPVQALSQAG
jgi:hypothetical protein